MGPASALLKVKGLSKIHLFDLELTLISLWLFVVFFDQIFDIDKQININKIFQINYGEQWRWRHSVKQTKFQSETQLPPQIHPRGPHKSSVQCQILSEWGMARQQQCGQTFEG